MFQEEGSTSVTSSPLQIESCALTSPHPWLKSLKPEERGLFLIHLLVTCANHVASGSLENANAALDQISGLASPRGDTMQRIASYYSEALADRALRAWPGIYKALRSAGNSVFAKQMLARKLFSEHLLFGKVAFAISNQAIVESMEGERMVHVIDLDASEPAQWRALIRDLRARPEGPPHLRITGIHRHKEALEHMAHVLTEEAEKSDIPFQFNPIVTKLENLNFEKLRVKTGEALAISSVLQLHTLLAGSFHNDNKNICKESSFSPVLAPNIDSFLSALWSLSPKVILVTEQDSDHNGNNLMERLSESLYYYAALFDCLESALPRSSLERLRVEKVLLGEEIKNIISCEGIERKERHERLEKWGQRLESAGFRNLPLSYYGMLQGKRLMQSFSCEGYKIREENGGVVICWQDRSVFSVSAWRVRR